jgi:capsular polysaccharide biosynthesis protein
MAKSRKSDLPNKLDDAGSTQRTETEHRPPDGSNGAPPRELSGGGVLAARFSTDGPTDLQDIARRTVGLRRWAIAALVVVAAIVAGIAHGGARTYTATTRVVLDTPDPTTRSEAIAIADTVQAIATSPSQVRAAIQSAHVSNRDPIDVAEHHVSVTGLGSSAIVTLSVSDADPRVAARLANALAQRVILAREEFMSGTRNQELADLDGQILDLSAKIAVSNLRVDTLNIQIAEASTGATAVLRAQRDAAVRQSDFLTQQRGVLESERVSILGATALRPKPTVIAEATRPLHTDPSDRLQYMVLGGLLGLIIGVGLAALAEMIRPTVVGGDAIARQFGIPLLGTLRTDPDGNVYENDISRVAGRVRLAARAAGVRRVELLGSRGEIDTRPSLTALKDAASASGLEVGSVTEGVPGAELEYPGQAGILLMTPERLKRSDVVETGYLVALRRAPLLGLVTYRSTGSLPNRVSHGVGAAYRRARAAASSAG